MDKNEIINALKTIKEVCEMNYCGECPLRMEVDECTLQRYAPYEWVINDTDNWIAFK